MNDLQELLRRNVESAPPDHLDLAGVMDAGRRRVRRRRGAVGSAALAAAGVVAVAALGWPGTDGSGVSTTDAPPKPDAPTISLADATRAVEGRDYEVLALYTNKNLMRDNGQYLDGVTDDGMILLRDGPRADQAEARYALMDPATGAKDWLPDLHAGASQTWPIELGSEELTLLGDDGDGFPLAYFFDRDGGRWSGMKWPELPAVDVWRSVLGPDDRLYVFQPATQGRVPEGGWPTGPDGEADDADAEGDTYHLWSASLDDMHDVRDEGMTVGSLAFTDSSMIWTDSTNGDAGLVHVRDLATGEEHSFDPHTGERCNLLSFGATDDRIVMGQYCGTYSGNTRDDRVQVLSTDGEQVATLQDNGVDGWLPTGSDVVNVTVFQGGGDGGTYVYDLATDRLLQVSDTISSYALGGRLGNPGQFQWHTPVDGAKGATQHIGTLLP
ncbi:MULTISPECIES: hypothetical protein [unclassified Nocardioides]|uniref:hypothetical protein n=1 Tax=unclassified Nocardioides TaxID=2615069 RepID=UPI0036125718